MDLLSFSKGTWNFGGLSLPEGSGEGGVGPRQNFQLNKKKQCCPENSSLPIISYSGYDPLSHNKKNAYIEKE